jgi:D-glycerate 3-kinase
MSQSNIFLRQVLNTLGTGKTPTNLEWQQLANEALESTYWKQAFNLTPADVNAIIQPDNYSLWQFFSEVYFDIFSIPSFKVYINSNIKKTDINAKIILSLWKFWLPLSLKLAISRQQMNRPFIQGILGGQGTGKTTLATVCCLILSKLGYQTLSFSLDDLYKTYAERQRLQAEDSRLIWRGPPGTHDVELGIELLDQLRQPNLHPSISVPRFDKSAWNGAGDRTTPELVQDIDIVLFEGWFVGVRPIDATVFDTIALAPIQTAGDRTFARDMNEQLRNYLPLWERLDHLMLLYPTDYRLSQQWRRQAEQQMIASGKSGMTDAQVDGFVEYFWKSLHPELFITPLTQNPSYVDLVVEVNPDHSIGEIYRFGKE